MVEHKSSGCQKPEKSLTFVKNRGRCRSKFGEPKDTFPIPRAILRILLSTGAIPGDF
jgi:hypothetical protein